MNLVLHLVLVGSTLSGATAPTISTQPKSQTVTLGAKATFSVVASGTAPLAYQWSKNGSAISGATAATYTTVATVAADNGASFTVKVSNAAGSKTSSVAALTVNLPPAITTQPANQAVSPGAKATFSVVASGTAPLAYQWSRNGSAITGATAATYTTAATVAADSGATFTVKVSNAVGTMTSSAATLTVNLPPSITTQPASQSVGSGSSATFSVVATGSGTLGYQWSKNGVSISGATASSYTTSATVTGDSGSTFSVKVTNSYGSATSTNATLTVTAPVAPTVKTQPSSQTVSLGATATLSVVANGTAPLTYQWSKNGAPITGATSASYTTPATVLADNGATYSVVISNAAGSVTSNNATLVLNLPPAISQQPTNQVVNLGGSATYSVAASGTGTLAYQWMKNGANVTGATAASYTTPASTAGDNAASFTVKVTNTYGTITSAAALLTVNPVAVTVNPTSLQTTTGATQTFAATVTGAVNTSVTWSVTGGTTKGTITSAGVYTAPSIAANDTVIAKSVADTTKTFSVPVTVTAVTVTISPTTLTLASDMSYLFSAAVTGTATSDILWTVTEAGGGIVDANGYYLPPTTPGTYHVVARSQSNPTAKATATVTVVAPIVVTITPPSADILAGGNATFTSNTPVTWDFVSGIGGSISYNSTRMTFTARSGSSGAQVMSATSTIDTSKTKNINIWVRSAGAPVISSFTASSLQITAGQSVTLSWASTGATGGYMNAYHLVSSTQEELVDPTTTTSITVSPRENTSYLLNLSNASGVDQQTLTITVIAPTVREFYADQPVFPLGSGTVLHGTFTNGTGDIQPGIGPVSSGFTIPVSPLSQTKYTLTVTNALGIQNSTSIFLTPQISRGTFTPSAVMNHPRYSHKAVRLADGRLLVYGGYKQEGGVAPDDADLFDPATGTFTSPGIRQGFGQSATLLMDGRVLFVGGTSALSPFSLPKYSALAGYIWDPTTGFTWYPLSWGAWSQPLPQRLNHSATLLLDGRVLVVGGDDLNAQTGYFDPTTTAFIFDPVDFSLTTVGSLNASMGSNEAALLPNGRVLVVGSSSIELFDPLSGSFTMLESNSGVFTPTLLTDGRVLLRDQIFDPKSGQFVTVKTSMGSEVVRLANGEVVTGLDLMGWDCHVLRYDPFRDALVASAMPQSSRAADTFTRLGDDRLLLVGGKRYSDYQTTCENVSELYDPQSDLVINGDGGFVNSGELVALTLSGPASNQAVRWSCSGGAIDPTGTWSASAIPGIYWVCATNAANASVQAFAQYQVRPIRVSFPNNVVSVLKYGQVTLEAVVTGSANPSLTWSVVEGAVAGSVTQDGVFTAGSTPGVYHVVARSVTDPSKSAVCTIKIPALAPPVITRFTVDKASVVAGNPITFSWDIQTDGVASMEVCVMALGGNLSGFLLENSWTYIPTKITSAAVETFVFQLRASNYFGTVSKTLSVQVGDPNAMVISPTNALLLVGDTQQFSASYWGSGLPVPNVSWSTGTSTVGSLSPNGLFTSSAEGLCSLQAQNLDAPGLQPTSAAISVMPKAAPLITYFQTFEALPIKPGATANLIWTTASATDLILTSSIGDRWDVSRTCLAGSGGLAVTPAGTTTYSLVATNALGTVSKSITIPVSIGVGILPFQGTLAAGGKAQMTAVLNGVSGVEWSVLEADGGTITADGLYNAPFKGGTYYTVVARAVSDPSLSDSLKVYVQDGVAITVPGLNPSPNSSITVATGSVTTFSAPYTTNAIWSVLEPGGGTITNASGTMGTPGVYTAPAVPGTYTIQATSYSDPNLIGQFKVIVMLPITITPATLSMPTGSSLKFGYTLLAATNQVTWSASGGTIASDGTYTAPLVAGTYTVTVTSGSDASVFATATVTVYYPDVTLSVTPMPNLFPGQGIRMGYQCSSGGVLWSATGGSFNGDLYTAPMAAGTYTLTATSILNPSVSVSVPATVLSPQVMIAPSKVLVAVNATYQFQWAVTGGALQWSVVEPGGGAISSAGLYTAPPLAGTFTVKAVSTLDSSVTATATVVVGTGGSGPGNGGPSSTPVNGGVGISPSLVSIRAGTYQPFNAIVTASDDQSVTWTVAGNPTTAKIDTQGVFIASKPGEYQVVATSTANGTSWGSATILVTSSVDPLNDKKPEALNREGYSVTALQNGKILIAGGWDGANYRSDCYLYDPSTQVFTPTGSLLETKYTGVDAQGNSFSMTVSAGRSGHTATLLKDGRVLIADGVGYWFNDASPNPAPPWVRLPFAQVYDPATGSFHLLPGPVECPTAPGYMGPDAYHINGANVSLENGQALLVGDNYRTGRNDHSLFDPGSNVFSDVKSCGIGIQSSTEFDPCGAGIGEYPAATSLEDGRVLITGGWVARLDPALDSQAYDASATIFDPKTGFSAVADMTSRRTQHTATRMADGRVLIVGGAASSVARINGHSYFSPVATAEIFDPATNQFTAVASMIQPRAAHAAILIPTGQILVVGGYTSQAPNADGSSLINYSSETELYDPDTNSWSVMDHLDYGLSEPKLVLMQDGSVFVAGQVQAPMEPPASTSQTNGLKMMAFSPGTTALLAGSALFGQFASSWQDYPQWPEEAALKSKTDAWDWTPPSTDAPPPIIPKKTVIGIPLPSSADPTPSGYQLHRGENVRHRYFILKVRKPSRNHTITAITVTMNAGSCSQVVLNHQAVSQNANDSLCSRIRTPGDIGYVEYRTDLAGEDHFTASEQTDENNRERIRKRWTQGSWLPSAQPPDSDPDSLVEYYRVRVTFDAAHPNTQILYGMINGALVSPPSDTLSYQFRLHYTVGQGAEQTHDIAGGSCQIQAHWFMGQLFGNKYYPNLQTGWNYDKWADRATFNWLSGQTNRDLLEPVNDISLEHGRNTGHGAGHLNGNNVDTFHPGFQTVPGWSGVNLPGSGTTFRDSQLIPLLQRATGWTEKDAVGNVTRTVAADTTAQASLVQWILAARGRIRGFMMSGNGSGFGPTGFIYMTTLVSAKGANSGMIVGCNRIRNLIINGTADAYVVTWDDNSTTTYPVLNLSNQIPIWRIEPSQFIEDTSSNGTHTNHLHVQWGNRITPFILP